MSNQILHPNFFLLWKWNWKKYSNKNAFIQTVSNSILTKIILVHGSPFQICRSFYFFTIQVVIPMSVIGTFLWCWWTFYICLWLNSIQTQSLFDNLNVFFLNLLNQICGIIMTDHISDGLAHYHDYNRLCKYWSIKFLLFFFTIFAEI